MANTISFTEKGSGAVYTIAELNQLFTDLAAVINAKIDIDSPAADGDIDLNFQRCINCADGVEDDDAITLGQAKTLLGL